ncbi:MAG: hypothetical protein WC889_13005, partial [Myxococcota bacterium]
MERIAKNMGVIFFETWLRYLVLLMVAALLFSASNAKAETQAPMSSSLLPQDAASSSRPQALEQV